MEEWKTANGFRDFTDLLEVAYRDLATAPGAPAVVFVDEAQDLSPLQLSLLRQWGRNADYLVMAGDDDQTISGFGGAAPEVLLDHEIPERFRHVLAQSYRVPAAVHTLSQKWIERVAIREPKEYRPRPADGEVRLLHRGNYKQPEGILDDADRYLANGKTVMILVTCSYMLEPLKAVLRKRGLPFHNPYRRKRGDWNPLFPAQHDFQAHRDERSLTAAERILAFLRPHAVVGGGPWTADDLRAWTAWLKTTEVLLPTAQDQIRHSLHFGAITVETLRGLFEPAAFGRLIAALGHPDVNVALAWLMENLKAPRRNIAAYPVRVIERGGISAVRDTPKIIIGTGHSVKGGEADVVYLFPDLSPSGKRSWEGKRANRDAVVRLGYVMMTRAKESLIICEPAGSEFMPIDTVAANIMRGGIRYGGRK